jgi:hypothetical protein
MWDGPECPDNDDVTSSFQKPASASMGYTLFVGLEQSGH